MNAVSQEVRQDHLSQCLKWTQERREGKEPLLWMTVPHFVGGMTWIISLAIQLLWHLFLATKAAKILHEEELFNAGDKSSSLQCIIYASTTEHCLGRYMTAVQYSLCLGLACCWWNPKLGKKPARARNKLLGLFKYYRLQFASLALRTMAWKILSTAPLDVNLTQASNALVSVLILLLSIVSWRTVQWEPQPQVNWTITDEPLTKIEPTLIEFENPSFRPIPSSNPPTRVTRAGQQAMSININDFGRGGEPRQPIQQIPTPPNEDEDDPDSMDWTPSQNQSFSLIQDYRSSRQRIQSAQAVPTTRSPFFGTLPANPKSQAAKLRNPQPVPRPIEMTPGPRDNPFTKGKGRDDDSVVSTSSSTSAAKFAPTRFFAQEQEAETGLEAMFSDAFRMKEEPAAVQRNGTSGSIWPSTPSHQYIDTLPPGRVTDDLWAKFCRLAPLLLVCVVWINAQAATGVSKYVRGACLIMAALVAVSHIGTSCNLVFLLVCAVEALGLFSLGSATVYSSFQPAWQAKSFTEDLGFWCLFGSLVQEIWVSFFSDSTPSSSPSIVQPTDPDQQTLSPPRNHWDHEEVPKESSSALPSLHSRVPHSSIIAAPSPASPNVDPTGWSHTNQQLSFGSPSPPTSAFGIAAPSSSSHQPLSTSHWEQSNRLGPERRPSFIPSTGGFSILNDVVAPRRSMRNQDRDSDAVGGRGGFAGLSLGGSDNNYNGVQRRSRRL